MNDLSITTDSKNDQAVIRQMYNNEYYSNFAYTFEEFDPPYPKNMFSLKNYTMMRGIAMFLLFFSILSFFCLFFINKESIYNEIQRYEERRGVIKVVWSTVYSFLWQGEDQHDKVMRIVESRVRTKQLYAFVFILFCLFINWIIFDWQKVKMLLYAFCAILFGLVYALLPVDLIPDIIPVLGFIDDLLMIVFSGGATFYSVQEHLKKRKVRDLLIGTEKINPDILVNFIINEFKLKAKRNDQV